MKRISPKQAIKNFCKICNGEIRINYDCLDHNCSLYPFKEGKGVYEVNTEKSIPKEHIEWLKKNGKDVQKYREFSEETKQKFKDRMKKAWETRKNNLNKGE